MSVFSLCWVRRLACGAVGAALLSLSAPAYANNYSINIDAPAEAKALLEQYLDIVRYRAREDIRDEYLDFLIDHAAEQAASLLATKGYFNSRIMIIDDRTGKTVGTDAQLSATQAAQATRSFGRSVELQDAGSEAETATPAVSKLPSYTI